jgi:hypothetical protein
LHCYSSGQRPSQKLTVPILQSSLLVGRAEGAIFFGHLVSQEEVEGVLEEVHFKVTAQFDAVNYLVLAEVGSTHNACLLAKKRGSALGVGTGQPDEGVEDKRRHTTVIFGGYKDDCICLLSPFPEHPDLLRQNYID